MPYDLFVTETPLPEGQALDSVSTFWEFQDCHRTLDGALWARDNLAHAATPYTRWRIFKVPRPGASRGKLHLQGTYAPRQGASLETLAQELAQAAQRTRARITREGLELELRTKKRSMQPQGAPQGLFEQTQTTLF